jgi:hypothetical protein
MNWHAWLKSLLAGGIGGAASSTLAAFSMPEVFNFSHDGWLHIGKLAFIGAIVPVLTYLKQSPLPSTTLTVTSTETKTVDITNTPK